MKQATTRRLVLYGRSSSLNTQRVLWCLHETGVPFNLRLTSATLGESGRLGGTAFGGTEDPGFVRCSPFGQIPALSDSATGAQLWESASIIRYLAAVYKPSLLGPAVPAYRPQEAGYRLAQAARASAWMDYHLSTFAAGANIYGHDDFMGNLMTHLVRMPAGGAPVTVAAHGAQRQMQFCDETVARAAEAAAAQFGRLDAHLRSAGTPYLAGDELTAASARALCRRLRAAPSQSDRSRCA